MQAEATTYWTAVANVMPARRFGPGGADRRPASVHFAPGAKVYIIDWFPGTCNRVVVVGLHRKTKRMIQLVLAVELWENFRSRVCYVPAVITLIKAHFPAEEIHRLNQEFAEQLRDVLPIWKAVELKRFAG
ncbi:hypothetical protein E4631_09815 [Hymenobacter sp. UV11]|uniref:hypothetical protein n=1 Tax=Hymenobacter sp. UV11 TaxID=1849735 RepID=UPI001060C9E3|nr:hypothetical protein [Hymenobacter sp. UV11]TDN36879.1 hypothetical protein A8B98_06905 [Hymenobacter sp. UV11]TFZ66314.1 hypothetical protein E4631_09815 [Hymenobacter sp. UV11]